MKRKGHALTPDSEGGFHPGELPSSLSLSAPVHIDDLEVTQFLPSASQSSITAECCSTFHHSVYWPW